MQPSRRLKIAAPFFIAGRNIASESVSASAGSGFSIVSQFVSKIEPIFCLVRVS
jgi:hypothetical protein